MGGKARMGLEPKMAYVRAQPTHPPKLLWHCYYNIILMFLQTMHYDFTYLHPPSIFFHDWRCGSQLVSPSSTTLASNALPGALTARSILFDLMRQSSPFASRAMSRWMTTRRRNFVRATTVGQKTHSALVVCRICLRKLELCVAPSKIPAALCSPISRVDRIWFEPDYVELTSSAFVSYELFKSFDLLHARGFHFVNHLKRDWCNWRLANCRQGSEFCSCCRYGLLERSLWCQPIQIC